MPKKLYLLNGLAIIAVVLNHASHWGVILFAQKNGLGFGDVTAQRMGALSYYSLFAIGRVGTFSVPAFLFVSGFFIQFALSGLSSRSAAFKTVGRRILQLLIPYIIWSLVYFFLEAWIYRRTFPPLLYLWKLVSGKSLAEYYYVPVLIQLYLLAVLLVPYLDRHARLITLAAFGLILTVDGLNYLRVLGLMGCPNILTRILTDWSLFFKWAGYFALGAWVGQNKGLLKRFKPYRWLLLGLIPVFHLGQIIEGEWLFRLTSDPNWRDNPMIFSNLFALAFIFWYLSAFDEVPRHLREVGKLSGFIYGIYLMHPIVTLAAAELLAVAIPGFMDWVLINQLMLVACALGLPILAMSGFKRLGWNRGYKILFG